MKPILFNTDMVCAVLEGRKTVTRRVVKPQPANNADVVPSPRPWTAFETETDMSKIPIPVWNCVRQRAGPLVKESRSIRPRLSAEDTPYDRAEKNKILRPPRDSSVCRTRTDRLEIRLALFEDEGSVYSLTFDREHEPRTFQDVRRAWRSFLYRLKKWRGRPFDYVYLIEGRHGDHRYHIHLVLRDSDFAPAEVRYLWKFGSNVDDQPLLLHARDTYRRTAKYFTKEATDGITIPTSARTWVCSRSLNKQLTPVERWRDETGDIPIPDDARCSGTYSTSNSFGQYRYAWYMEKKKAPPELCLPTF